MMALPNPIQKHLLILGLFSGLREGELQGLRWDEVDLPHKVIRIPASRMKGKRPFELPMSTYVHDVLVARRAVGNDGPFVFPGTGKSRHCQSFAFALGQIKAATGLQLSPHDLRRTFISVGSNSEISAPALKRLVGHASSDVTDGYTILSAERSARRRAEGRRSDRGVVWDHSAAGGERREAGLGCRLQIH